jgi:hypothetical protein
MTKNTKTLLTIAGVGVVGYIIYNQFIKKGSKNFADFTRGAREGKPFRTLKTGICGDLGGCVNGRCKVPIYGQGNYVQSVYTYQCSGDGETMKIGQLVQG